MKVEKTAVWACCLVVMLLGGCGGDEGGPADPEKRVSIQQGVYGLVHSYDEFEGDVPEKGVLASVFPRTDCVASSGERVLGEVQSTAESDRSGFYQIELPEGAYAIRIDPPRGEHPEAQYDCFDIQTSTRIRYDFKKDMGFWQPSSIPRTAVDSSCYPVPCCGWKPGSGGC